MRKYRYEPDADPAENIMAIPVTEAEDFAEQADARRAGMSRRRTRTELRELSDGSTSIEAADPNEPRQCEQDCGKLASVYAIDPRPGGWGGYYCKPCASALGFQITDRL